MSTSTRQCMLTLVDGEDLCSLAPAPGLLYCSERHELVQTQIVRKYMDGFFDNQSDPDEGFDEDYADYLDSRWERLV